MNHKLETQLEQIQTILEVNKLAQKDVLTLAEASKFTGLSKSFLYKLTSQRQIPFYKLGVKLIYFKKSDLEAYLLSNRQAPTYEIVNKPALLIRESIMEPSRIRKASPSRNAQRLNQGNQD
jgi:excisionase family DNA binding protein